MSHHQDEGVAKVAELVDDARIAMLTTMTADGRHVSRPMALQEVEFDGDLWFFCHDDSDKVAQLRTNPQVNVSFSDQKNSAWTSVSGAATLVEDRAKAEELWSPALEIWFPDGLETPTLGLVKVHVETAEYWSASDSRVKRLIGGLRAAVTGDPDKFPAENETVRLDG
ncbi:pyridoxamine 5'-phosphate oxidase family protein [Nocardioides zeae]|uniref:Pyridoxamine 5'-phosphate oxidase family protein n=1 Tax=Nocardioides imazamoxiresistens TaxID=3231893 RepID=A0ABU3Q1K9_9ACTN|nr:pyridoxamine 5'-phosphate oxidase family protein [Nocardioides zeae]MDT9595397.1 pyridoxamine 5'-phosphate oxidase family protein [Nocardioides zeae]